MLFEPRHNCPKAEAHGYTYIEVYTNGTLLNDRTVCGLGLLVDHGVPFRVSAVAVAENKHDILGVMDLGTTLGAEHTRIDIVRPTGSAGAATRLPDNPELLAQKWLLAPDFVAKRDRFEHNRQWNACWAGKLSITPDGRAMPCVIGRADTVGNVAEMALATIIDRRPLQSLWA